MRFITGHKARFGVEPICRVLSQHGTPIAPSTYYAAIGRPPSARARRDEQLRAAIIRVRQDNYDVKPSTVPAPAIPQRGGPGRHSVMRR